MNPRIEKAKALLAKGDNARDKYYAEAADEILAALDEDSTLSYREIGTALGRSHGWVKTLCEWRTSGSSYSTPYSGPEVAADRDAQKVRAALKDPERRTAALRELPTEQVEAIAREAAEVSIDRARAERAERGTTLTAGQILGGDKWDPSEDWIDEYVIRVDEAARKLAAHAAAKGFVLGSMSHDDALARLERAERVIAEYRALVQERVHDEVVA